MPIDTTEKQLNIASDLIRNADLLMEAITGLVASKSEFESSGLTWDNDVLVSRPGTKHVDGNILNAVMSSADTVMNYLTTNFHDDNFQKARP